MSARGKHCKGPEPLVRYRVEATTDGEDSAVQLMVMVADGTLTILGHLTVQAARDVAADLLKAAAT